MVSFCTIFELICLLPRWTWNHLYLRVLINVFFFVRQQFSDDLWGDKVWDCCIATTQPNLTPSGAISHHLTSYIPHAPPRSVTLLARPAQREVTRNLKALVYRGGPIPLHVVPCVLCRRSWMDQTWGGGGGVPWSGQRLVWAWQTGLSRLAPLRKTPIVTPGIWLSVNFTGSCWSPFRPPSPNLCWSLNSTPPHPLMRPTMPLAIWTQRDPRRDQPQWRPKQAGRLSTKDVPRAGDLAEAPAEDLLEEGELSKTPAEESPSALAKVWPPSEGSPPVLASDVPPVANTPAAAELPRAQELVLMDTDMAKCASLEHQVPEPMEMDVEVVAVGTGDPVFQPTILEEMPSPLQTCSLHSKRSVRRCQGPQSQCGHPWMLTMTKTPKLLGLDWICLSTTHVLQDILSVLHK